MEKEKIKGVIEAILFASGRVVKIRELMSLLEINSEEIISSIAELEKEYATLGRGLEIVRVEDGYQLASKKEYHEYIYPMFSKGTKPTLSQASLEVLSIIAYNNRATKADVDTIRGVDSSASIYRLLEYNLIEQAGKADLPGKPMTYKVTDENNNEKNEFKIGEKFFNKYGESAVLADASGKLTYNGETKSMHEIAALMMGQTRRVNAFDYLFVDRDGHLVSINDVRENYRKSIMKNTNDSIDV